MMRHTWLAATVFLVACDPARLSAETRETLVITNTFTVDIGTMTNDILAVVHAKAPELKSTALSIREFGTESRLGENCTTALLLYENDPESSNRFIRIAYTRRSSGKASLLEFNQGVAQFYWGSISKKGNDLQHLRILSEEPYGWQPRPSDGLSQRQRLINIYPILGPTICSNEEEFVALGVASAADSPNPEKCLLQLEAYSAAWSQFSQSRDATDKQRVIADSILFGPCSWRDIEGMCDEIRLQGSECYTSNQLVDLISMINNELDKRGLGRSHDRFLSQ